MSNVKNAAKGTGKSMRAAAEEIKEFYECEANGIYNVGVSGNGT